MIDTSRDSSAICVSTFATTTSSTSSATTDNFFYTHYECAQQTNASLLPNHCQYHFIFAYGINISGKCQTNYTIGYCRDIFIFNRLY